MQRDNDRDRAIERVLRHSLSAAAPADDRACVDGEILAAWTEGHLRGADAKAVERHLSGCARCQQVLAMLARTAPPPVIQVPLWRRWRLQWLVPIATAATVAAIWVATPPEQRASYSAPPSEQSSRASQATPAQPETAPPTTQSRSDRLLKGDADSSHANEMPGAGSRARGTVVPPAAPAAPKREEFERRDAAALADLQKTPAAPLSAEADDGRRRDTADQRAQADAVRETAVPQAAPRAPQAAPPNANEPSERRAGSAVGAATFRQAITAVEVVSPNPSNRWRILGAEVTRTTNGGTEWTAVTLPSTTPLTAGMSPAPSICWIVGRGGAIYLTTDGLRFVRIAFPEPIDLVSITATDDQRATVTSADGRTFTTADRGMTWTAGRP